MRLLMLMLLNDDVCCHNEKVRSELRNALKVSMGKAKPKKQHDKSGVEEEMKTLTTTYEERLAESEKVKVALQKRISKLNEVQASQRLEADSILKQKDREIDDVSSVIFMFRILSLFILS
jgi:seryl-tRNA synthetase